MKLLTEEIIKQLPPLYSQEKEKDPMVIAKFFNPSGAGTWWAIEFDGENEFFGYVDLGDPELGYFYLSELSSYRGAFGLGIERDLYFEPCRLSKIKGRRG